MKKEIAFLLLVSLTYVLPVFWQARNLQFRLDSDYDSALPILYFVTDSIRRTFQFPLWNPYFSTGVSVIGDPLSFVLNPIITIPSVILGVNAGLRIAIFICLVLSGISMMLFLGKIVPNSFFRLWSSILYLTSGSFVARVAAGHLEKILSFPMIPLFFFFTIIPEINFTQIIGTALTLTMILFSGDFYTVWFLTIFLITTRIFYIAIKRESIHRAFFTIVGIFLFFVVFSSVKLVPYISDVFPKAVRFSAIDPYAGSIHAFLAFIPFIMPFRMIFYDRPSLQRILGFHFNWYEYYAFISPLPFLLLFKIRTIIRHQMTLLLLFLIGIGIFYISLKYPYSPFYWLFHFVSAVRNFRVPQRIFMPMVPIVIALLTLCTQAWWEEIKSLRHRIIIILICLATILWTFFSGQQTLLLAFERPRNEVENLIQKVRLKDSGNYFVANFICCDQTFLIRERIPILNYYYGWRIRGLPVYISNDGITDFSSLRTIRPTFIVAPKRMEFYSYSYTQFLVSSDTIIWKTDSPNIFPVRRNYFVLRN